MHYEIFDSSKNASTYSGSVQTSTNGNHSRVYPLQISETSIYFAAENAGSSETSGSSDLYDSISGGQVN